MRRCWSMRRRTGAVRSRRHLPPPAPARAQRRDLRHDPGRGRISTSTTIRARAGRWCGRSWWCRRRSPRRRWRLVKEYGAVPKAIAPIRSPRSCVSSPASTDINVDDVPDQRDGPVRDLPGRGDQRVSRHGRPRQQRRDPGPAGSDRGRDSGFDASKPAPGGGLPPACRSGGFGRPWSVLNPTPRASRRASRRRR